MCRTLIMEALYRDTMNFGIRPVQRLEAFGISLEGDVSKVDDDELLSGNRMQMASKFSFS